MNEFQMLFDQSFKKYKQLPMGIYGTGNNAEIIVRNISNYNFVCIISDSCIGDMFHGLKIVSIDEAVCMCQIIIIAAVPSSTSIVFGRICKSVPNNIMIFDMRGKKLEENDIKKNPYWNKSKKELIKIVDNFDIISFDVFDTLIQRTVLELKDQRNYIEEMLKTYDVNIPYAEWRATAEQYAVEKYGEPSIKQIYQALKEQHDCDDVLIDKLIEVEFNVDRGLVCQRCDMVDVLRYVLDRKKRVFLTSDMYFSTSQIRELLKICNVPNDMEILVSNELGVSKVDGGIYEVLKEKARGNGILHIGDNYDYDYIMARKHGVSAYWIMSHYEMFCNSMLRNLLDYKDNNSRKLLGEISVDFFNGPFDMSDTYGKVKINTYRKLAHVFSPITVLFEKFIKDCSKKYDLLLFPSRDGYFLFELYKKLVKSNNRYTPAKYFYASRSGVGSAIIKNEQDIIECCKRLWMNHEQNVKLFLENQFQIRVGSFFDASLEEILHYHTREEVEKKILEYKNEILTKSSINRQNYKKYIDALDVNTSKKIAVIDIVTHGSLVKGISDLIENDIDLIALGTSSIPNINVSDLNRINSIYGNVNKEINGHMASVSELSELHLLLEIIYSSREGQFLKFDDSINPVFLDDSKYDSILLDKLQSEMVDVMRGYNNKRIYDVEKDFALDILSIAMGDSSCVSNDIAKRFTFTDPYDQKKLSGNIMEKINACEE